MTKLAKLSLMVFLALALILGIQIAPAPAKPIVLKYATMNPPTSWHHTEFYVPWAEKVKNATEGRVTVKIYPSSTLGKPPSFFDLVKTGIADIALGVQAINAGQFPLSQITSLPFLQIPSGKAGAAILWRLYEKYPAIQKEYEGIKFLHAGFTSPCFFMTTKKPIRNLEDVKGVKLRAPGGRQAEAFELVGANPVAMHIAELYMAIEKGVIDGLATTWEPVKGQLPVDKLRYATVTNLWAIPFWIGINPNSWARISPRDQEAMMKCCAGLAGSEYHGWAFGAAKETAIEIMNKEGWKIFQFPESDYRKWAAMCKPIHEKYINSLEAKGLPARAIYNDILKMIKEYK
ncbi:MAG: TRAP transporter substrate-binding protein [Deltaproteobacteria bacterium]|nr:TRAP transporter substrate-binding protein [Deltaproteobacteria bacterium]